MASTKINGKPVSEAAYWHHLLRLEQNKVSRLRDYAIGLMVSAGGQHQESARIVAEITDAEISILKPKGY